MKDQFVFEIEEDENMLVTVCHDPEMATQGENLDELITMIRDLVRCRFDEGDERLHWPFASASCTMPCCPSTSGETAATWTL